MVFHGAWLITYTTSGGQEAGLLAVRLYAGIAEKALHRDITTGGK